MIKVREVKIAIEVKRSDADDVLPVAMFNQNLPTTCPGTHFSCR